MVATILLIVHGLVAVALLGALTHQTLATWAPGRSGSFFGRFRRVPPASFANAVVILYVIATLLGATVLAACWLPARRASRLSPLVATRGAQSLSR